MTAALPSARGRLDRNAALAPLTWLRVGGPAEILFVPADPDDLQAFLAALDAEIPVGVIGFGSNLLVRDGGVRGVTIRLGRGFGEIGILDGARLRAGAFAPAARVARAAAEAGIGGLEFLRGIPGTLGGALAMNAGCYGGETAAVLERATAIDRAGRRLELAPAEMEFAYRGCGAAGGRVFVEAVLRGRPERPEEIHRRMRELVERREASQPVRERTGGSTFRNPSGRASGVDGCAEAQSAWRLIDAAGCRGLRVGGAEVSDRHANFLVNRDGATAADLESLAEEMRRRVRETAGIELSWEIRRMGEPS